MPKRSMASPKNQGLNEDLATVQSAAHALKQIKIWLEELREDGGATQAELRHSVDLACMSATRLACELGHSVNARKKSSGVARR